MNPLWSIFWLLLLLLFVWYLAGIISWFCILLLPLTACIPGLKAITDGLLMVVQLPFQCGVNIREGKRGL
eukprot:Em0022g729a